MAAIQKEFSLISRGAAGVYASPVQNVTDQVVLTVDGEGVSIYNVSRPLMVLMKDCSK
jgi:hypothetical protein